MKTYKAIFEFYNEMIGTWSDHGNDEDSFVKSLLAREGKGEYIKEFTEVYEQHIDSSGKYSEIHTNVDKYNWLLRMVR